MLFQKKFGCIVLKEESNTEQQIELLKKQLALAPDFQKKQLQTQIKLLKEGEVGEKNILFELKNSGIDMYVLHDIRLVDGERSAQIDFIVITRQIIFVIESKNLIGDIEIDESGSFIRSYEMYGKKIREGFYSPITQNERHLQIIHDVKMKSKNNALLRLTFNHWFSDFYKPLVVLANPKNCIQNKCKDKSISEQVIRADQLISTIKKMNKNSKLDANKQKQCLATAEQFMNWNASASKPMEIASAVKTTMPDASKDIPVISHNTADQKICPRCGGNLILRVAKSGKYAGNRFYGCSNYPKCRYIQNEK